MRASDLEGTKGLEESRPLKKILLGNQIQGFAYLTILPFVVGGSHTPDVTDYIKLLAQSARAARASYDDDSYNLFIKWVGTHLSLALMRGVVATVSNIRDSMWVNKNKDNQEVLVDHDDLSRPPTTWPFLPMPHSAFKDQATMDHSTRT